MNYLLDLFGRTSFAAAFLAITLVILVLSRGTIVTRELKENVAFTSLNSVLNDSGNILFSRSSDLFKALLAGDNSNQSAAHGLGMLYASQGNESAAVDSWTKAGIPADYLLSYGKVAQHARNHGEAFRWFDRAVGVEPINSDAWYLRGQALAQTGQWEASIESYHKALQHSDVTLDEFSSSDILCSLGWTYHWLSNPRDPQKALHYYSLAHEEADFSSVERESDCLYKQAELYRWQLKMPEKAIQTYEAALQEQPENVLAASALIKTVYGIDGNFRTAEEKLKALIAQFPNDKWAYYELGDLYAGAGYSDLAAEAYCNALAAAPEDTQTIEQLESLGGIECNAK